MPTADFAAAQERLAARRQQRLAENRARDDAQRAAQAATLSRLPGPLGRVGSLGATLWNGVKGREGTRPDFRVGQVDAELLDEELLDLLKGQVGEGLKYFGVGYIGTNLWQRLTVSSYSHTFETITLLKSSSPSEPSSSNSQYGITTPRTAPPFKVSATPMPGITASTDHPLNHGRKPSTD